eukprot:1231248-Ditylum_brightwellii.AAC.1
MCKFFFENYDDSDLDHDLQERRTTSFIFTTTKQVSTHWEISKQPEPTGATTNGDLCCVHKGINKSVDVRHFNTLIGYTICELTAVHEDSTGTIKTIAIDWITPTHRHHVVKIHNILYHKNVEHIIMFPCSTNLLLADPYTMLYGDFTLVGKIKRFVGAQYYVPKGSQHHNLIFKHHEVFLLSDSTKPSSNLTRQNLVRG